METYKGYINEFVDWVTGQDTSSQENTQISRASSTGMPVSGGSIRELIQSHLKKPFVSYEDTKAGLYRMFSSEDTKNKWIRMNTEGSADYNPEDSTKLELFNFVRPSDVILTYNGLDPNPKYIINGDSNSNSAQLSYNVYLSKESGGGVVYESDSFTVTYRVVDANGVEHVSSEEKDSTFLNSTKKVTKNIYSMLSIGQNTVTVNMKARNSSAANSVTFPVYLITFELESSFDYSAHWDPSKPIDVPISIRRSDTSLKLKTEVYIDGQLAKLSVDGISPAVWDINNTETNPTRRMSIANTYAANQTSQDHIKHTLRIEAQMYDLDMGITYYSNVLLFDFIVASSTIGIVNRFITTGYSVPYVKLATDITTGRVILQATQYEPFVLPWAYYTDRETTQQTLNIEWATRIESEGIYTYTPITTIEGQNKVPSENLRFIPDFYTTASEVYLVALYNGTEIEAFPMQVEQSSLSIVETGGYNLRLQAYGKSNQSPDREQWIDSYNNITTTFTGIQFDNNSGWDDNSFITSGVDSYAIINYVPLPSSYALAGSGKTIEIDFKPEKIVNEGDILVMIGDPAGGHINISTNRATLYNGVNEVIHTNYKANERIKLAFVFNPVSPGDASSNLIFIMNNGVLERAASYGTAASYRSDNGYIKIGGSASGVRVYNIRCYNKALDYNEELNNYIYDCEDKAEVINRNDIFTSSVIDYTKVKNKIDTVLITGNLDKILSQDAEKDESTSTVSFKRECITDPTKTFEVINGMIRKHGQSTLNYPITSMKIWTNKSKDNELPTSISLSEVQVAEGLNKNRYIMKTGAIPANKFVLQANYADSSGTHNGSLLSLIQNTWYDAQIDGRHILRTAPQLFTSGEVLVHNDSDLHEDGSWVEGYGVGAAAGKTWPELTGKAFPYKIRVAPDSFPCAVFYQNGPDDGYHFLGQYVFMDDKKSDYTYGERSIYHFGTDNDPFVLKTENTKNGPLGKQDTAANRVWDNANVLRIEVVLPNTTLSSYMNFNVTDGTGTHSCTDIKYDSKGNAEKYYWEDFFEMIFPDEDDLAEDDAKDGLTKFSPNSRFVRKAQPFINFLKWITDCKQNYANTTDWWSAGTYSSTQQAFEATAAQHLDLYKVAAYYIFFLRFGLVDSVERNVQLKTYDGQHWHYEPWDMDIALGNTNQGALVLDPPLTRNSFEPGTTTYAFSGKSDNTSNVLFDCLENWEYWSDTVVPKVAQALYEAGLDYNSVMEMFDDEYAKAWSETMYNQSGYFKYVENGGADWLAWLQGSRTSHRHWWVSTSMNYYDAKWSCGSFNSHRVRLFTDKAANSAGTDIVTIKPTSNTFFKIANQEGSANLSNHEVLRNDSSTWKFDVSTAVLSAKDPAYIYGGTFIEEIDLSCMSQKLKAADFSLCYDDVLGAPIKKLSVGLPYTINSPTSYSGKVSGTQLRLTGYDSVSKTDAFENLQVLDITGQSTITSTQELLGTRNRKNVTDVYAIGSGITEFVSSTSGNKFNTIKLPAVTTTTYASQPSTTTVFNTLAMTNSSWQTIEFWNTTKSGDVQYARDEHNEILLDEDNNPIIEAAAATFTKTTVPYQIQTVQFKGSTASNECAGQFVLDWITAIDNSLPSGHTEEDLYTALASKNFEAENINWGVPGQSISITYQDLARIAHFNNGNNQGGLIKGYIMLSDNQDLTSVQVNNIVEWFGPSVFTKSSKNSGLVVDHSRPYVQITTSGTQVINGEVCLTEGHSCSLTATRFILSEGDNYQYDWSLAVGQNVQSSGVSQVNSVRFQQGDDGVLYLIAEENGTYGDYYITVTASQAGVPKMLTIKIIGAVLPDHIDIMLSTNSGGNARKFYLGPELATAMQSTFGTSAYDENNNNAIRDSYVLYIAGQEIEFYARTVDGATPATVQPNSIRYSVSTILPLATEYQQLTGYENTVANRVGDGILYYAKCASHNGIVIGTTTVPQNLALYTLKAYVTVGARTYIKTINIIAYDDTQVLHSQVTSPGVQNVLNTLHTSLYGNSIYEYHKSDLLSLVGTLDFSVESTSIGTLQTNNNQRLLEYLPNITSLNFSGCNNLQVNSLGSISSNVLTFATLPKLTNLNMSNVGIGAVTIDLTNCPNVATVDLSGTTAGIKLASGSPISSISLGSPVSVSIVRPKTLTSNDISITDSSNLESIELVDVNSGDLANNILATMQGYNMFNILYTV